MKCDIIINDYDSCHHWSISAVCKHEVFDLTPDLSKKDVFGSSQCSTISGTKVQEAIKEVYGKVLKPRRIIYFADGIIIYATSVITKNNKQEKNYGRRNY